MTALGACTTLSALTTLANEVFGAGSPNVQSVIGKLNNLDKSVQAGDITNAQAQAQNIVSFVQQKAAQGTLPGTSAQIDAFLGGVLCYAGLSPNTYLIQPTDNAQIITSNTGNSGLSLEAHTVTVPTLLTITELDPNGPSGLVTKLDQYPSYISITTSSQFTDSAVVAVCIPASLGVSLDVFNRLRLGHQASTGFEITPPADPSFLGCPAAVASASKVPQWLQRLASLLLPKPLFAGTMMFSTGGVGGSAINFSPFGAVDNALYATGGVGGTAINFQRAPAPSTAPASMMVPGSGADTAPKPVGSAAPSMSIYDGSGNCVSADTTVGAPLNPLCRPVITIKTAKGTIMTGVPVSWAVTSGGGTIAPDTIADGACTTFGSTANDATDVNGQAGVCWTLGPNAGTNTVTGTPTFGGDAPSGVVFVNSSGTTESGVVFTATGDLIQTTATAAGASVTYDGLPHPGAGSCSNGLTPALTYTTTDGTAPVGTGSYTLTVTCGVGSTVYGVSTATATITISLVTPTVAVTCPASEVFTGSALTPCTATATAPSLSLTPTPTYTNNTNAGTATASVTVPASGNYAVASGSATFTITPATTTTTLSCTAQVYTGSPVGACGATVTGVGGLSQAVTPVTYSNNTNVGTASASATFAAAGNYQSSTGTQTFVITKAGSITTVLCPASAPYNAANQNPCNASASGAGGLNATVAVGYVPSTVLNAGAYSASAAFAGDANHLGSSGSGGFTIAKLPATATAGSGTMSYGGPVPSLPCGVGGLLSPDGGAVTCTTSLPATLVPGTNITVPIVSPTSPLDYVVTPVNGTLAVRYVQSNCFASPIYSSQPPTKSYQKLGSNLPVKCTLLTATGSAATNATGNLTVTDKGLLGTSSGNVVFQLNNAFTPDAKKNYSYGLNTGAPGFVSGHYYLVTAAWNDGSTTTGWFYIK